MADLKGYTELQTRLKAIENQGMGPGALRMLGLSAVREQKLLVRRKTGTTGRTIHVSNVTQNTVTTQAAAAARWLEFGTKPHIIRPKVRRALRWAANASDRRLTGAPRVGTTNFAFATEVNHPGTKPYPFMLPGARKAISKAGLLDRIVEAWNKAA